MRVQTRLFLYFAAVTAVLSIPSLLAVSRLAQLHDLAIEGRLVQASAVADLGRLQTTMVELDRLERSFIATADTSLGMEVAGAVRSLRESYESLAGSRYQEHITVLAAPIDRAETLVAEIAAHVPEGRMPEATESFGQMMAVLADAEVELQGIADVIDAEAAEDFARARTVISSAWIQTLVGLAIALLLTIGVAGLSARAFTKPLGRLNRAMVRVADGSLDTPEDLPYARSDEIGELSKSFATMARRLDELNRTKAEFLGMASHELKTPLNLISTYAEMIQEELGPDLSAQHGDIISEVVGQAKIMTRRVSRLMDVSRLEAGAYQIAPESIEVEDLMTGVYRMFERQAEDEGVDLNVRISPSAPRSLTLDVDLIRDEVLGNLITNALRFASTGGWIELAVTGDDQGVVFTVTDSGPGIRDEHRNFVFGKHYTVDRTRLIGSGLGLAIAKELVELHGGLITLEPAEEGRGARFRVALPLAPSSAALEVPADSMIAWDIVRASAGSSTPPARRQEPGVPLLRDVDRPTASGHRV